MNNPTYGPDACCGAPCCYEGTPGQPCWGPVSVVDEVWDSEDSYWVHVCEGHDETWDGGKYRPEPK